MDLNTLLVLYIVYKGQHLNSIDLYTDKLPLKYETKYSKQSSVNDDEYSLKRNSILLCGELRHRTSDMVILALQNNHCITLRAHIQNNLISFYKIYFHKTKKYVHG